MIVQKYDLNVITPTNAPQRKDGKVVRKHFFIGFQFVS
jgi:hypothetical protein